MPILLDTNAALRYVLNDIPEQALKARAAVDAGAEILPEVLCECVYVLGSAKVYRSSREEVARVLGDLLDDVHCERKPIMRRALALFAKTSLDFVDCILAAAFELEGRQVLTFDKKLTQLIDSIS